MTRRATFGLAPGIASLMVPMAASATSTDQVEANNAVVMRRNIETVPIAPRRITRLHVRTADAFLNGTYLLRQTPTSP